MLEMAAIAGASSAAIRDTLVIPAGRKIKVDGVAHLGEWADADSLVIRLGTDWVVPVLLKHDGDALLVAFSNLVRSDREGFPEVLIDGAGDGGPAWDWDDWWLHAGYVDCVGQGAWDEIHFDAHRQPACVQDAAGWDANNFPLSSSATIEFRIDLEHVGLKPRTWSSTPVFGLALDVAESTSRKFVWPPIVETTALRFTWPTLASIREPRTWALARLAPVPAAARR